MTDITIMECIKKYFSIRNISEDDFALESAYKAWQRFQVKFLEKSNICDITKNTDGGGVRYTLQPSFVLKKLLTHFEVKLEQLWSHPLSSPLLINKRKYIFFILIRYSSASYRDLSKLFRITYPAIHKNVQNTQFLYDRKLDDEIVKNVDAALDSLFKNSPLDKSIFCGVLRHGNNRNYKTQPS
jgi:hypothetical protein